MKRPAFLFLTLAACSGSHAAAPDAPVAVQPDASVDAPPQHLVQVDLRLIGAPPQLIAYRDGTGPWQAPTQTAAQDYQLHVTSAFEVVAVCPVTSGFDAERLAATAADASQQTMYCGQAAQGSTVAVTGQMVQAGTVSMSGATDTSATGSWSYQLGVPVGTHDLIAVDADHVAIRRALSITAATSESSIDLTSEGAALASLDLTVTGTDNTDMVGTTSYLFTAEGDFATIATTGDTTALVPPGSLLGSHDFEEVNVFARSGSYDREGYAAVVGSAPSFALPPRLTGVTFAAASNALTASWSSPLPDYDRIDAEVYSTAGLEHFAATRSWMDETGATSVTLDDSGIPGYQASWNVDLNGPYLSYFAVEQTSSGLTPAYVTALENQVNTAATPARAALARARARRAARLARARWRR